MILTFGRVFGFVLAFIALTLWAVGAARGDLSWSIGFVYLGYETWMVSRLIRLSRAALRETEPKSPGSRPTMTVLVPARNECLVLPACLDALLGQDDTAEEIWIVDDGSEDGTQEMLSKRYGLEGNEERRRSSAHPQLFLWSKETSGKARSFNQLLPACTGDLIVTIDADTVITPGSLRAFREAFGRNSTLAAGCGILEPRCRGRRLAGYFQFFQRFEYVRAFLWRLAWSRLDALVLVSGAFAVYRRDVLVKLGGFAPESWVEDYELMYRLHRVAGDEELPWKVRVVTGARATTDAPGMVGQFLRQRARWFGGFLATLFANRDMVGEARYGRMGRQLLPIKTIDTLLPLVSALAHVSLLYVIFCRGLFNATLLGALGAKLLFDLAANLWTMNLYSRWLDERSRARWLAAGLAATVLEPFCFQPLRTAGALLGWIAFLRNRFQWESQRWKVSSSSVAEPSSK